MSKLANRKTWVVALAAAAVLGGGVAFAYPPGTNLTVSATATPTAGGKASVLVTIANADPSCKTKVTVRDTPTQTQIFAPGQTTGTFTITAAPGRSRVKARTFDCAKPSKEHARSTFVILDAKAVGRSATIRRKSNWRVEYTGLDPDSAVTATATLDGSSPLVQLVESENVDQRGEATVKFKFKTPGHYVISTQTTPPGTAVNSVDVTVTP
jgi:hypothetical protein